MATLRTAIHLLLNYLYLVLRARPYRSLVFYIGLSAAKLWLPAVILECYPLARIHANNGSQLARCDVVPARRLASKHLAGLSHRRTVGAANGWLVSRGHIYEISYDSLTIISR